MIKTVPLSRRSICRKLQKSGRNWVLVTSPGLPLTAWAQYAQFSITLNSINGELRPTTKKRFSLSYVCMLNLILLITNTLLYAKLPNNNSNTCAIFFPGDYFLMVSSKQSTTEQTLKSTENPNTQCGALALLLF